MPKSRVVKSTIFEVAEGAEGRGTGGVRAKGGRQCVPLKGTVNERNWETLHNMFECKRRKSGTTGYHKWDIQAPCPSPSPPCTHAHIENMADLPSYSISMAENWIRKMADTLWFFSILPFGNHIKRHGSNFNQGFSFYKSNLKYLFVLYTSLMRFVMSLAHKDLISMNTPVFLFQNWSSLMINIQWTKFERKSIATSIWEELPWVRTLYMYNAANEPIVRVVTGLY